MFSLRFFEKALVTFPVLVPRQLLFHALDGPP